MSNPLLRHLKIIAPFNSLEKVVVTDIETLCRKIGRIKNDGVKNLQIVSDFDFTLTRFHTYGIPSKTSVTIAQVVGQSDERKEEVEKLIQYYSPIEHSNLISESIKANYMKEWWFKSSKMLIEDQLEDKDIENLVLNSQVYLRHGIETILDLCKTHSIHFTVLSAGFGNIVSKFFEILSFRDSLEIFSNFLLPNSRGKLVQRTEPFIVSIEKSNVLVGKTRKENFIILGDMASVRLIQDSWVVEKIPYEECIKIGFLNKFDENRLKTFESFFDLVLLYDGNLLVVEKILETILGIEKVENLLQFLDKLKL